MVMAVLRWNAIAGCCPRLLLAVTPVPRAAVHRHAAALQDARAPALGAARDARALPLQRGAVAGVAGRRAAGRAGARRARPGRGAAGHRRAGLPVRPRLGALPAVRPLIPPRAPALRPRSVRRAGRGTVPRGGPHEAPPGQVPGRLPAVLAATARPAFPRPPGLARAGCARRFLQDSDPDVRARTDAGLAKFRAVAERALTAAGLHLPAGAQLWTAYRRSLLSRLPLLPLSLPARASALYTHAARPSRACARINQREGECDEARLLWERCRRSATAYMSLTCPAACHTAGTCG